MELNQDWKEFFESLIAKGVRFMILGAAARSAFGIPRMSGDVDVFVERSPANADRLVLALEDFGFGSMALTPSDFTENSVIQLGQPPRGIDILMEASGVVFEDIYDRRELLPWGGMTLPFISRQDYIANKLAAGRPKDLADVAELRRLSAGSAD